MGAPIWLDYACLVCKTPNVITYAAHPRINEEYLTKNDDGSVTARCTDCQHKHLFLDSIVTWIPADSSTTQLNIPTT
jgi:aspartate carbamoyltransferase regulatory subunit